MQLEIDCRQNLVAIGSECPEFWVKTDYSVDTLQSTSNFAQKITVQLALLA